VTSYQKLVKNIMEKFQQALSPLDKIVENQETIISQNALFQETLTKIYQRGAAATGDVPVETPPENQAENPAEATVEAVAEPNAASETPAESAETAPS
jgi:hypothetical protein